jgi:two-component system cell cycle sensor histidine kinase/response regulator CckA
MDDVRARCEGPRDAPATDQGVASVGGAALDRPDGVPAWASETILVVDDDAIIRDVIRILLLECGYVVIEAASGWEALRLSREHDGKIHLLLTDVVMPGMDGTQLAEAFVSRRSDTRVLFVSGSTNDALKAKMLASSAIRVLPKPFSAEQLSREVRAALDDDQAA